MAASEGENSTGMFLREYEKDRHSEIFEYLHGIQSSTELPHQEDEWGCVSATGSFIINQLHGSQVITPAELDVSIERQADKPGDTGKLTLEMFKHGVSSNEYTPFSPLDDPAKQLINGEIDIDTYVDIYQEIMGKANEADLKLFKDNLETYIPSWLAGQKRFESHKKTGQLITHDVQTITKTLVGSLVDKGNYIFATELKDNISTHAVAIYRPDLNMPALVFTPDVKNTDPENGSSIELLSEYTFRQLSIHPIAAVALWNA